MKQKHLIIVVLLLNICSTKLSAFNNDSLLKRNRIGIEFSEIPRRSAIIIAGFSSSQTILSFWSVSYSRIFSIKKVLFIPEISFQTEKILQFSILNFQSDINSKKYITEKTQSIITNNIISSDWKLFIKQKILNKANAYLYEELGCNLFFPLFTKFNISQVTDTFLIQNNSLVFQSSSKPYNHIIKKWNDEIRIRFMDDLKYYIRPHVGAGILILLDKVAYQFGLNLYYLDLYNGYIYSQSMLFRVNFAIWF